MSLINDMLRDLDRRGAAGSLPVNAVAAKPVPRRRTGTVIVMVAALLLIPAAGWLLLQRLPTPSTLAQSPEGAAVIADPPVDTIISAGPLPSSTRPTTTPLVTTPSTPASTSMPLDANSDQSVTPATVVADAAPATVVETTLPATSSAVTTAEPARLPAASRESGTPLLLQSPKPIATVPAAPPATAAVASAPDSRREAVPTAPLAVAQSPASPEDDAGTDEPASRLSIRRHETPSADTTAPADDLLQQARTAIAARRGDEALHLLQLALARAPEHHQARLLLAGLQAERGLAGDAIATLEAGLARDARQPMLAEALGRLHLQQRDPVRAAAVLAAALPPLDLQPGHHALLALAWQQAGQPAQAARVYQSLVEHDARVGAWWLGLGLARDALGDKAAARAALQQAERAGGLADGVLRYVRQRIGELGTTP